MAKSTQRCEYCATYQMTPHTSKGTCIYRTLAPASVTVVPINPRQTMKDNDGKDCKVFSEREAFRL